MEEFSNDFKSVFFWFSGTLMSSSFLLFPFVTLKFIYQLNSKYVISRVGVVVGVVVRIVVVGVGGVGVLSR